MRKKLSLKRIILILMVCSGLIGILTVSYAFFVTSTESKDYVIYTGNLQVDYAKRTSVIQLEDTYPMSNQEGSQQTPHEFTVTNHGNIDARYQIRLELDKTVTNMIPLEYIRISYAKNNGEYSKPVLLSDLNSSLVFVKNTSIKADGAKDSYGIKLWIDISAPNEIQGKEFKAQIVVDSIQDVEDGYVVDTAPVITLKKDAKGNQDVHLKVGDEYHELGVEKVEDDQEIFTTDDVKTTIEYYNGTDEEVKEVQEIDTTQIGIYYITYHVTDESGNIGQATRIVTINQTDSIPDITLKGDSTLILGERDYYQEEGVEVEEGNKVVTIGEVKTSVIGSYSVKYIVVDQAGNLNSKARTVQVTAPHQEEILHGADPVLASNLIPVTIEDNGTVTRASTLSTWYSYENKQWANAVILKDESKDYKSGTIIPEEEIESYFVWIPRYRYQIFNDGNYPGLNNIENSIKQIEIIFENKETPASKDTTVGGYLTHPAFTAFNTNGLWVGKFETGYDGATKETDARVNESQSDKIIIKPNVYSWRNITVGNAFEASYNYQRNLDSHMMKNTEWGAVAYLSHSQYGTCTNGKCNEVRINNNSAYITGYAAKEAPTVGYNGGKNITGNYIENTTEQDGNYTVGYFSTNPKLNQSASTTGNRSGIYDMSGGAWEYVMGYATGGTNDHSGFTPSSYDTKYYDVYTSIQNTDYNQRILGDATGEMGPFGSEKDSDGNTRYKSSWYKDYAYFVSLSYSWFYRGGNWSDGTNAGFFAFINDAGGVHSDFSYRIVLAP